MSLFKMHFFKKVSTLVLNGIAANENVIAYLYLTDNISIYASIGFIFSLKVLIGGKHGRVV